MDQGLTNASQGPPALLVENLEVVYHHSIQALRGLSVEVAAGAIVALLGSNGAGKTTVLKAVSGILPMENGRVASGRLCLFGEDIATRRAHALARAGMAHVREGRHVFEDLTVEENLKVAGGALKGRGGTSLALDLAFDYCPRLAPRRHQLAGYLSGGEQQMLAIGRALVGQPRLMLLDEPSLGLAPIVVADIFEILQRINREQGVALLIVEQNARLALEVASYGYIMENGRIVLNGSSQTLRADADVQRFYLGQNDATGPQTSFRDVKHYKRRKRWLS
jgi:branched-chain amino acid transport system ATP-binding protein